MRSRPGKLNPLCDGLSRDPLKSTEPYGEETIESLYMVGTRANAQVRTPRKAITPKAAKKITQQHASPRGHRKTAKPNKQKVATQEEQKSKKKPLKEGLTRQNSTKKSKPSQEPASNRSADTKAQGEEKPSTTIAPKQNNQDHKKQKKLTAKKLENERLAITMKARLKKEMPRWPCQTTPSTGQQQKRSGSTLRKSTQK